MYFSMTVTNKRKKAKDRNLAEQRITSVNHLRENIILFNEFVWSVTLGFISLCYHKHVYNVQQDRE